MSASKLSIRIVQFPSEDVFFVNEYSILRSNVVEIRRQDGGGSGGRRCQKQTGEATEKQACRVDSVMSSRRASERTKALVAKW